jgi:hypothetical protein
MRKVHFVLSALFLAAVVLLRFYLAGVGVYRMPQDDGTSVLRVAAAAQLVLLGRLVTVLVIAEAQKTRQA